MAKDLNYCTRLFIYFLLLSIIFCIDIHTFYPFMYIKEWILKSGLVLMIGTGFLIDVIKNKKVTIYISWLNLLLLIMIVLFSIQSFLFFGLLKLALSSLLNILLLFLASLFLHKKIVRVIRKTIFFRIIEYFTLIIDIIAVLQIFGYYNFGEKGRTAIMTSLGNVNFTAFFLGISIIISTGTIIYRKYSVVSAINILFSFPILFYCRSRAAFFWLILLMFIMFLSISDRKKRKYSILAFSILLISILLFLGNHNNFRQRYIHDVKNAIYGNEERSFMWNISMMMIEKYPLGVSLGGYPFFFPVFQGEYLSKYKNTDYMTYRKNFFAVEAHNEYLQLLAEGGIVLFIIFGFFMLLLIKKMIMRRKKRPIPVYIIFYIMLISLASMPFHVVPLAFLTFLMLHFFFKTKSMTLFIKKRASVVISIVSIFLIFFTMVSLYRDLIGNHLLFIGSSIKENAKSEVFLKMAKKYIDDSPRLYFELGNRYAKNKKYDLALSEYSEALSLSNMPAIYSNAGYVLARVGSFKEAEKMILTALKIDPKNYSYRYKLGICYYLSGKYKEAISQLNEVSILAEDESLRENSKNLIDKIARSKK